MDNLLMGVAEREVDPIGLMLTTPMKALPESAMLGLYERGIY